jgi:dipeptidyl-peptidase-4
MRHGHRLLTISGLGVCALLLAAHPQASAPPVPANPPSGPPTIDQFLGASSAIEVTAAAKTDRVAWIAYERGKRNVYTAVAPAFTPVRLTNFTKDDGVDLTNVRLSADGSAAVFVRGSDRNAQGWSADPSSNPDGPDHAIWAARVAAPGVSWAVASGIPNNTSPAVAPDGSSVLFAKDGQIYRARISPVKPASEVDRGEKPFISAWGTNSAPTWSPDGSRISFVSDRHDHSFIAVYDMATRSMKYLAPGVDHDTNPVWSLDGKSVTFVRRPGTPFGQQDQAGGGGIGLSAGPAYAASQARGGGGGRGGGGRAGGDSLPTAGTPGLMTSTFRGGYSVSLWTSDVVTGEGHEIWRPDPGDRRFNNMNNLRAAGTHVIFPFTVAGGRGGGGGRGGPAGGPGNGPDAAPPSQPQTPVDEWDRYYSIDISKPNAAPIELTTTDGLIEDQTDVAVSADGQTVFYCTNATDIERRHIWAVPSGGGTPRQVTTGNGIETYPAPLASGAGLATLSASWNMPMSLGLWKVKAPDAASPQRIVFPMTRPGFPAEAHVEPQLIVTHPADGAFEIHNQLFLPKDIKAGDKRPAMIFVHGGPVRQMLLGYHYRYVYHQFYGMNEWLAAHGYVVLSINYRSGIGYGRSFRTAPNTEARGNSEYQDVVAGAEYLRSRPDVDTKRIGIYGLSYGGLLTAQALARNSDIFAAGVDYAGVHLYGSSLNPSDLSYQSSAISSIDKWTSPVLIIQGDDDRNVNFAQSVGLVQLLRQRNVDYELIVFPDDVHDSLIYSRWIYLLGRMDTFLQRVFGN